MKIVKEKLTNKVLFAGNDLQMDDNGVRTNKFRAPNVKPDNHILLEVDVLPSFFKGGMYTYDSGTWTLTDLGVENISEILEGKRTEKLAKFSEFNTNFIAKFYSFPVQQSLLAFYADEEQTAVKKNDVKKVWDWVFKEILPYYYTKRTEIENASTIEALEAITWDYSSFEVTDPKIKLNVLMS